jgi:hypothetical protein
MYRVCRDPLLPVQARLWPPDVLFWEFVFRPKNFQFFFGNHANTNIKMWPNLPADSRKKDLNNPNFRSVRSAKMQSLLLDLINA